MTRAAVYTRYSKVLDPADTLGVDRQEQDDRAESERRGWSVAAVYTDNDVSASSGKPRPAYDRMLADIQDGLLDAVVVWDLDRLHRRPIELERFLEIADRHQLQLASVGGDVDLSTPQGVMIARIKAAVARHEIDQMRRRLKRKMDQLAATGQFHGGRRPYGYTPDGMTVIPAEVAIIQECAARLLAGESFNEVVRDLNQRGVKTTSGVPWTRASVKTMLLSPRVAGLRQHRGEVIGDAAWPAILDRATWEAVRALLRDPARRQPGHVAGRRHLLSGIARCSACGGPMSVVHRPGRSLAYACRKGGCGKVRVAVPLLDEFIERLLFARLAERQIGPLTTGEDRSVATQIAQAEAHQAMLAVELGRNPAIRPEARVAALAEAGAHLDELYARQARQRRQSALAGMDPAEVPHLWRSDQLTLSRKRLILRDAIGPITVKPATRRGAHLLDVDRVDVPPAERLAAEPAPEPESESESEPLLGAGMVSA